VRFGLWRGTVLNQQHLRRLLSDYIFYYHYDRTHLGLGKCTPGRRRPSLPPGQVVARPRLGGLHHPLRPGGLRAAIGAACSTSMAAVRLTQRMRQSQIDPNADAGACASADSDHILRPCTFQSAFLVMTRHRMNTFRGRFRVWLDFAIDCTVSNC
jgi:hypothetical protein